MTTDAPNLPRAMPSIATTGLDADLILMPIISIVDDSRLTDRYIRWLNGLPRHERE